MNRKGDYTQVPQAAPNHGGAMTTSRPPGGRESATFPLQMKVTSSPATELALTNKAYCSFADAHKLFGSDSGIARVSSQLSTVLTLESHKVVADGLLGLNAIHRKNIKVSANDNVQVARFVPEKDSDLVMLTVDLEFVKFRGKQETLDANNISQKLISQFGGQVMTKDQKVTFEYIGTNYIFVVKETIFKTDEPKEFGILAKETILVFETAGNSGIKIANQKGGGNTNLFKRKDFNFQKLGIGGLDKEFESIFRRAFASRVFPSDVINRLGIHHVKGMLLFGPPGTGKTLIARQIGKMLNAKEPKIVNGPEVLNKFVGGTEENIRALFADAEADQKSNGDQSELHIIIFDEIDAICKTRGSTRDGTGVHDSIVNQLLTKIDGVDSLNNILLIGMTNRKDMLDEALLRPGRLEVQIEIGLPDEKGRFQILQIHTRTMRDSKYLNNDVRLEEIAQTTKNFSGAELEGLVKSASSFALTRQVNFDDLNKPLDEDIKVFMSDFKYALEDVKPAFGAEVATLERCRVNAMLDCGEKHSRIISSAKNLVEQVMKSERTPLLSCLLEGPSGSGKTAIAATVALESDFPFIKVDPKWDMGQMKKYKWQSHTYQDLSVHLNLKVSAENMVGLSESTKCGMINKVFEDAYKSPLSIIILDDIERILEFVNIGPRFSNLILQTLLVLIKRLPPKDRKLLIIGTTSMRHVMESMDVLSAFNVSIHVPMLKIDDIKKVLQDLDVFTPGDVEKALDILPEEMPIKRLLMLLEMSKQGGHPESSATVAAGEGKIDLVRFRECFDDLS